VWVARLLDIWPNMVEVKDWQQLPNGGARFVCVYKMASVRFEVASEDAEFVVNRRIVSKTKGGVESTIAWDFQPEDGGTRVTIEAEYSVPIPLLGKLAETIVVKRNEREIGLMLGYLKAKMERVEA